MSNSHSLSDFDSVVAYATEIMSKIRTMGQESVTDFLQSLESTIENSASKEVKKSSVSLRQSQHLAPIQQNLDRGKRPNKNKIRYLPSQSMEGNEMRVSVRQRLHNKSKVMHHMV